MVVGVIAMLAMFVIVIVVCSVSPTRNVGSTAGLGAIASAESMPVHDSGIAMFGVLGSSLETSNDPAMSPRAPG